MSRIVEIPGGTAVLRDPDDLKIRHRRLVESAAVAASGVLARIPQDALGDGSDPEAVAEAAAALSMTRAEADAMYELQDATIVALLERWTLPDDLPTMETVGDMDPKVYDALAEATKAAGAKVAAATDFGPDPEDGSPTVGSEPSNGPLTPALEPPAQ